MCVHPIPINIIEPTRTPIDNIRQQQQQNKTKTTYPSSMATTYPSPQLQPPTILSTSLAQPPLVLGPPLKNTDSFRTRFKQSRAARVSSHYCCCFPLSSGIWVLSIFLLVSTSSLIPTNKPLSTIQPANIVDQHHPTCLSTPFSTPRSFLSPPTHTLWIEHMCGRRTSIYLPPTYVRPSTTLIPQCKNVHFYFYAQYTPHSLLDLPLPLPRSPS